MIVVCRGVLEVWLSRLCGSWIFLDIPLASPKKSVAIVITSTFSNGNRIQDELMVSGEFVCETTTTIGDESCQRERVSVVRLRNLLLSDGCQILAQPDLLHHRHWRGCPTNNDWLASPSPFRLRRRRNPASAQPSFSTDAQMR